MLLRDFKIGLVTEILVVNEGSGTNSIEKCNEKGIKTILKA